MFGKPRKNERLETKLKTLQMNFENNYKDAAKLNYEEYWSMLEELSQNGTLKENQVAYYRKCGEALRTRMADFHHQNNVKSF